MKSFLPPRGMEALLMTAALGFMRPMPATHKQEVDALAITTHLIRLFKGHVRPCSLLHSRLHLSHEMAGQHMSKSLVSQAHTQDRTTCLFQGHAQPRSLLQPAWSAIPSRLTSQPVSGI